jgi:protein-S-isoprenylcysteine O-methyltransferase Ste14
MKKRIRVQGTLVVFGFILFVFLARFIFQNSRNAVLDEFLDFLGWNLVLLGFLFRISGRGVKSEMSRSSHNLVTAGSYSLTRNPMYFGTFLIGTGIILILCNWWVFPLFVAIYLSIYIPQMRKEEEKLSQAFGDAYIAYCKKTPKFFPNFKRLALSDAAVYLPVKSLWIKSEFNSLAANVVVIFAMEIWESVRVFGHPNIFWKLVSFSLIAALYFIPLIILSRRSQGGS